MALDLTQQYPQQVDGSTPEYPLGKARNVTSPDDNNATPLDEAWLNDHFGFQQALLAEAGVVPSGEPDTATGSQYLDAVKTIVAASPVDAANVSTTLDADGAVERAQADVNAGIPYIESFNNVDSAATYADTTGDVVDGAHKTYDVAEVPNLENFHDADFKKPVTGGDLHYATGDYRKVRKSKISNTIDYTTWTQDKCFEYNGVIYAPYQMSTQHTSVGQRIVWSRSFDKGNTWTQPEVILDAATNPSRGYNCFSMGESGGRVYAMMEWRTDTSSDDTEFYLYSRPLDRTRKVTGNITKAAGATDLNVLMTNHGLIAGDFVYFTGTGVTGASGKVAVKSVVDKDNFKLATTIASGTAVDNAGVSWYAAVEFLTNSWAIQQVTSSMTIGTGTSKITHVHSFANIDGESFIMGFGFGGVAADPVRQVGYFHVQNIHGTAATLTKYRINAVDESFSTEPCVIYDSSENRVYLTTRNQATSKKVAVTRSILNSGTWESLELPFKNVFCNMPIVKRGNKLYVFGTERGKNSFIDGNTDYIALGVQDVATYMYEITDFDVSTIKASVLTYDTHGGDSAISGTGVGSAIYAFGKLMYFYGSESADSQHLYGSNASNIDNRSKLNNNGFQPDIMLLEITLEQYVSTQDFALTGYDGKTLPIVRGIDNIRTVDAPIKFKYSWQGDLLFANSSPIIGTDSVPGSDNRSIVLTSSSAGSTSRGAFAAFYGANHASTPNRGILAAPSELLINTPVLKPWSNGATDIGTATVRYKKGYLQTLNLNAVPVYADNAAATTGGLIAGDIYRTATGQLMIVY